jgi:hypothetical protein
VCVRVRRSFDAEKIEIKFWRLRLWWKICNRGYAFGGSMESGGRFYVIALNRNLALVSVKMFSHSVLFTEKFCTFCSINTIYKVNPATNYITVQHKEFQSRQLWQDLLRSCSCRWGDMMSLNYGHQRAYCSSCRQYDYEEPRWNYTDRAGPKNSEKSLSQCHFVHQKSHMDWLCHEPRLPWGEAGD